MINKNGISHGCKNRGCVKLSPGRMAVAYRFDIPQGEASYVSELPGHCGVDWGYVRQTNRALPLSPYWLARFAANARECGFDAHFLPVDDHLDEFGVCIYCRGAGERQSYLGDAPCPDCAS